MKSTLRQALSSKNAFVRKGAIALLTVPRWWERLRAGAEDFRAAPPVLANSVPKSGTHLLFQIVDGLPNRSNYGAFLSSMTSSFRFRERSPENAGRFIRDIVPGEIVRGHLFYHLQNAEDLAEQNVVHYFIYRDPRDVVVSEAHYLRDMNRWHRLAPFFHRLPSMEDAIALSITGFDPPLPGILYPHIGARIASYQGWLKCADCMAIRFEDLVSDEQPAIVRRMAEFYAQHCDGGVDVEQCAMSMAAGIAPEKSHTFRKGQKAGWQREFTPEHRRLFDELAGEQLIELGYESSHDWAKGTSKVS